MATSLSSQTNISEPADTVAELASALPATTEVGLLTGGFDRPYAFGLAMALASQGITLDVIGSDEVDSPEMHSTPRLRFFNLRGNQRNNAGLLKKITRIARYYARLIGYAAIAKPQIFHILWNNKFQYFDRTFLTLYYKALGKKIVLTVHNVNAGNRDGNDSVLNRFTLKFQYRLADHIFVHTVDMKRELLKDFGIEEESVSVIPFGINNSLPDTDLTPAEAKRRLGIKSSEKVVLFFGALRPYKGAECLIEAFEQLASSDSSYRLIVAAEPKRGSEDYTGQIQQALASETLRGKVIPKLEFIPDEDVELYFKAADVTVLPYKYIFQSGVLFLAYNFGLPVIATDVGSFRADIIEDRTGFVCQPSDPADLAAVLKRYFASDLFAELDSRRQEIRDYAYERHSWDVVGQITRKIYAELR